MRENISFIKINNCITDLVLPKCNLVFGNSFSSVYLQLLLNLNHNQNDAEWKRNKCWMGYKTIANNINCGERKVMKILNEMQKVGLIKKEYRGKLYMFSLINEDYSKISGIANKKLDKELIKLSKNKKEIKEKINEINVTFDSRINYYFNNLDLLKKWLIVSEQIKPGTSLLFLMIFANSFINNDNDIITSIPENVLAKKMGTSQSTINRILNSFEKAGCFTSEYCKTKKKTTVYLNKELMNVEKIIENVNDDFKVTCPICNKEVENDKKLINHIKRCKDDLHLLMKDIIITNSLDDITSIIEHYNINVEKFNKLRDEKKKEKKPSSEAMQLVKYYYSLTNTRCPNWGKEVRLIKSHIDNGLTLDEVTEIMKYMAKKSYQDLRFFSNSINDALIIKKCRDEIRMPGSPSYLVRKYYVGTKQQLNDRLMLQGVRKINELKLNGYNNEQIELIVDYLVDKKCPNFNFIINTANEALKNAKNKKEMAKAYTNNELVLLALDGVFEYGTIMMKDNDYDIAEREIILRLKEDLCAGKVDLIRVNKRYNKFAIELAKEIFRRNLYDNRFTAQQWANAIHLNLVNF